MEDTNAGGRVTNLSPASGSQETAPRTTDLSPPALSEAKSIASDAGAKVSALAGQMKDKAVSAVEGQKEGIAGRIDVAADTIHRSGQQFAGKQDWIASAIERAAAELSSLSGALRENDLGQLAGQIQSFAKRQPALFIGAAFAAGFALARFGKVVAADVSRADLPTMREVGHEQR